MLEGVRRYSGSVFLDGEDGMYLHAYDVADAWAVKLAEIRAAVEGERMSAEIARLSYGNYMMLVMRDDQSRGATQGPREKLKAGWLADRDDRKAAGAALDALLAEVTP